MKCDSLQSRTSARLPGLFIVFAAMLLLAVGTLLAVENIAVMDFTAQGIDQASTSIITDRVRTEMFKIGGYSVVERQAMQDILKEQGFQQTGCTTEQCAVEMGQLLGVTRIIVGTVGKIGSMTTLTMRMIDVTTGKILFSDNVDCRCSIEDVMTRSVPALVQKLPSAQTTAGGTGSLDGARKALKSSAGNSQSHKKSIVPKILFGTGALAGAALGYVVDGMIKTEVSDNVKLKSDYAALGADDTKYDSYKKQIEDNDMLIKRNQLMRTIGYAAGGVCAVGFVLTFVF